MPPETENGGTKFLFTQVHVPSQSQYIMARIPKVGHLVTYLTQNGEVSGQHNFRRLNAGSINGHEDDQFNTQASFGKIRTATQRPGTCWQDKDSHSDNGQLLAR